MQFTCTSACSVPVLFSSGPCFISHIVSATTDQLVTCTMLRAAAVVSSPPQISMAAARAEAEMVMFESIKAALAKANLKPSQVCPRTGSWPLLPG